MALHEMAPIDLRPRRRLLLLIPLVLLSVSAGCGHRRQSMRPVYLTPAPAPVPSTTIAPACPTTVEPGLGEPAAAAPSPSLGPASPSLNAPAPAVETPPRAGVPAEPSLDAPTAAPTDRRPTAAPGDGTSMFTPDPAQGSGAGRGATPRVRQTSLREKLRPFVNDPDDLFQPPKADRPWKYIVLHHSADASGNYAEIDREHRKVLGWDGCGYHFVIGNGTGSPDGQVEVAQRWSNQKHGVHCRNGKNSAVNEYGIGICLVGDLDDKPPTPRQIAAARALVAYLGDRYRIPGDHIGSHAVLASSPTACPGKHFPTQAILGSRNLAQR